jgi:hypothetical protein
MTSNVSSLAEARIRLHECAAALGPEANGDGAQSPVEGLSEVAALLRAADEVITLSEDGSAGPDDLVTLARAIRHMAFLILGEHNPDQAWFWTPEWQAGERQADEDIVAGRLTRYGSDEEFLTALRSRRRDIADL